jgi:large subunit ribosomal protein L23
MAKKSEKAEAKKLPAELEGIILSPRVTEKAAYSAEKNAYTFNVAVRANKIQIARAIAVMYNVHPVKVTISLKKPQMILVRNRIGMTKHEKKATVFLPKGETIEIA